jgi:hypothetical protein
MGAMPSRAQSQFYRGLLPIELSIDAPALHAADLKDDRFANERPSFRKRTARALVRFLITFCIGVAGGFAWQSYSDAARQILASLSPQLRWLAPQAAVASAVPDTIEQITRNVDRIVAASQDRITRSIDHLASGQEEMTREMIRLRALSQYGPYRNSEHPTRAASAPASKSGLGSSQAPAVRPQ